MMGNIPSPLSNEEIIQLFKEYKNGSEKAREKIINHNIRLVGYIVNKYFPETPFDSDDLESTGFYGLIKAVDSFDIDKNITFATFASRVIYNEICMSLRKTKGKNIVSLEDTIGTDKDGKELTIGDTLFDERYNFAEKFDNEEILKMVRDYVLNMPDSREKQCIVLYFGFNCNALNHQQIANVLGISQSYVSRIINETVKNIGYELVEIGAIDMLERIKWNEAISLDELPSDRYNVGEKFKDNESFNIIKEFVLNMPNSIQKQVIIMYYGFGDKSYDKHSIVKFLGITTDIVLSIIEKTTNAIDAKLKEMNIRDSDGNYITLSSFDDAISNERAKFAKMSRMLSIFEILKTNDKELVKQVIASLNEEEKNLFDRRNGDDLDNPILSDDWTKEDSKHYNRMLVPKMRNYFSQLKCNGFIVTKQSPSKKASINDANLVTEKPVEFDGTEITKSVDEAVEKDNMDVIDESFKIVRDYILSEPNFTEKSVTMMYLGFNGEFYSQKEIAQKFGYSASNISHMISKFSKKIDEKLRRNNIKDKEGHYMTVDAFRKYLSNQKHKKNYKKRKLLTIYEQLNLSDKGLIDRIINSLSDKEKQLFERRNGSDLDNPILSDDWTKEDGKKYINIITKMKKILMKIQNTIINEKQEELTKEKEINPKEDTPKEGVSSAVIDLPKEETTEDLEITTPPDKYIGEEGTYWPNLDLILERMPHYEAFIVGLSLGLHPNGRSYSTDEIANFLNIDKKTIIEIVKNTLLLYKKNFNNFIDELINEEKANIK